MRLWPLLALLALAASVALASLSVLESRVHNGYSVVQAVGAGLRLKPYMAVEARVNGEPAYSTTDDPPTMNMYHLIAEVLGNGGAVLTATDLVNRTIYGANCNGYRVYLSPDPVPANPYTAFTLPATRYELTTKASYLTENATHTIIAAGAGDVVNFTCQCRSAWLTAVFGANEYVLAVAPLELNITDGDNVSITWQIVLPRIVQANNVQIDLTGLNRLIGRCVFKTGGTLYIAYSSSYSRTNDVLGSVTYIKQIPRIVMCDVTSYSCRPDQSQTFTTPINRWTVKTIDRSYSNLTITYTVVSGHNGQFKACYLVEVYGTDRTGYVRSTAQVLLSCWGPFSMSADRTYLVLIRYEWG